MTVGQGISTICLIKLGEINASALLLSQPLNSLEEDRERRYVSCMYVVSYSYFNIINSTISSDVLFSKVILKCCKVQ